jgi:hypothetical protein
MLVLREYFNPATGSGMNLVIANALIVSSTTGATRSMNVIAAVPTRYQDGNLSNRLFKQLLCISAPF